MALCDNGLQQPEFNFCAKCLKPYNTGVRYNIITIPRRRRARPTRTAAAAGCRRTIRPAHHRVAIKCLPAAARVGNFSLFLYSISRTE